ncbi:Glutathione S-transferase kappa 1 [Halotydeus destructor]|nr:Glutathione S-transferase kappa 1 [Halotydeus destructor]
MTSKKIVVDLFYDVVSPYSFLCFEQLTRHRNIWPNVSLQLRPFLLAAVMKGSNNMPPMTVPAKAKYSVKDLERLSKFHHVPLKVPSNFLEIAIEKGTLKAMRFTTAIDIVSDRKQTEAISRELYKRIFNSHKDVVELESFREAGKDAGLNEDDVNRAIQIMDADETKKRLRKNTDEALEYGAFGAPTIVAHTDEGPQLFIGSDRVELLAHQLGVRYAAPLVEFSKL